MLDNPRKVIQNQEMFSKNDSLLVAVSGGLDSMVLCTVLYDLNYSFALAHCNYQLRNPDSDLDEAFLIEWATKHQVKIHSKSVQIPIDENIQEQARKFRYQFCDDLMQELHYKYLLTAHHANDQLEGLFLSLNRGSGLKGLKGMLPIAGHLIRPFLQLSKADLLHYAQEHKITFREDVSNQSNYYLRNFFRNDVLSLIDQRLPVFESMALRSISHLQELYSLTEELYSEWKAKHCQIVDSEITIKLPDKTNSYFFSLYLAELEFHSETIVQIKLHLSHSGKLFSNKTNLQLAIHKECIKIRNSNQDLNEQVFEIYNSSGTLDLDYGKLTWETKSTPIAEIIKSNDLCYFDFNKIKFPLSLRKWQSGDCIQAFGMNGKHKKLQDIFTDKKIGVFDKEKYYLLTSGTDIIWVCGLIRSDIAKINSETNQFIQFAFIRKE